MSSYARMLSQARFYRAKSEAIDSVEEVAAVGRLRILRVHHGGTSDYYQVLIDDSGADVLTDPDVASAYVAGMGSSFGTLHGSSAVPDGATAKAISGEQSNTSLSFIDADGTPQVMVKVFRKLEAGLNPDVELLSRIGDCSYVAAVRGWVTEVIDGEEYVLAMIQDYVRDGRDGWERALDFAAAGDSFAAEARQLGQAMRAVHEALVAEFGAEDADVDKLVSSLNEHVDELAARRPQIAEHAEAAREVYARLRNQGASTQRIHGDLHLGQVLRTPDKYVLIDFEGEPARPLAERRRPDSPLRDVAGMLRSLDYAAHFHPDAPADPQGWARDASAALLEGYGIASSDLLDAYVLDKALYEVDYESDNRPDWVGIPLAAVNRLLT